FSFACHHRYRTNAIQFLHDSFNVRQQHQIPAAVDACVGPSHDGVRTAGASHGHIARLVPAIVGGLCQPFTVFIHVALEAPGVPAVEIPGAGTVLARIDAQLDSRHGSADGGGPLVQTIAEIAGGRRTHFRAAVLVDQPPANQGVESAKELFANALSGRDDSLVSGAGFFETLEQHLAHPRRDKNNVGAKTNFAV